MQRICGLVIIVVVVLTLFSSCKKKDNAEVQLPPPSSGSVEDNEIYTVTNHAFFLNIINDLSIIGAQTIETGSSSITSSCAVINFFNDSVYFDFGSLYCECSDGVLRKGRLIYDFSASTNGATSFRMPGFVCKIKSVNYGENLMDISIINKVVANISPLSISNQTAYSGINLTWKDTSYIQFRTGTLDTIYMSSAETITLSNTNDSICYKGQGKSLQWEKVKFIFNHKSTGRRNEFGIFPPPEKENFHASASNLVRDFTCAPSLPNNTFFTERHPFISGVLHYFPGTRLERVYDCGNGTCDNDCLITIGSSSPLKWSVP